MTHPIPAPRRPVDFRSNKSRSVSPGPVCADCAHRTCRAGRAQKLPRLGGHRSEFVHEHHQAAQLQACHPRLLIYYGEATQSFWVASPAGLSEAGPFDELLVHLWNMAGLSRPAPEQDSRSGVALAATVRSG